MSDLIKSENKVRNGVVLPNLPDILNQVTEMEKLYPSRNAFEMLALTLKFPNQLQLVQALQQLDVTRQAQSQALLSIRQKQESLQLIANRLMASLNIPNDINPQQLQQIIDDLNNRRAGIDKQFFDLQQEYNNLQAEVQSGKEFARAGIVWEDSPSVEQIVNCWAQAHEDTTGLGSEFHNNILTKELHDYCDKINEIGSKNNTAFISDTERAQMLDEYLDGKHLDMRAELDEQIRLMSLGQNLSSPGLPGLPGPNLAEPKSFSAQPSNLLPNFPLINVATPEVQEITDSQENKGTDH